ncbi:MAG: hypothetical protein HZB77_07390 [Chloroflexi bacterium]|nr:hypothetical protein [Chloroflexota bacterium]
MNRQKLFLILIATAVLLVSCGPSIVVENKTSIPVRVIVRAGGKSEMVLLSRGESLSVEASEGVYRATAIPDETWIEYAKSMRKFFNDQLADSDKLTGAQLLDVIRSLKDIAQRMQQYEQAASSTASCGGRLAEDSTGLVVVSTAGTGGLVISCK